MNDYTFLSTNGAGEDLCSLLGSQVLAFDVEATGVNMGTDVPYGFSVADRENAGYYAAIDNSFFRSLLADGRMCVAHNAKYDRSMMKKAGVVIDNLCDTMIAAHLLENEQLSLAWLYNKYYWITYKKTPEKPVTTYKQLGKQMKDMSLGDMGEYSIPHSMIALWLWDKLDYEIRAKMVNHVFWDIEMPLVPVLSDMELNGIMVDRNVLGELAGEFNKKISVLEEGMNYHSGSSGVNYNSPAQVSDILYGKLGVKPLRTPKEGKRPSVDARYLVDIKDKPPFLELYLVYKRYKTLKHSYADALVREIVNGRVHCSFNQTRTGTGRLSSSGPNLQKIPKRSSEGKLIRTAFVVPEGSSLIKADYDQLELILLAHCSQDPNLIDAFVSGRDIHEETALRVFGSISRRRDGKTLNYQVIFGGGGISRRKMFFTAYPVAGVWIGRAIKETIDRKYTAKTLGGRLRHLPPSSFEMLSHKQISHGGRQAISTIIQGSAAEEVKKGMVRAWHVLKDTDAKMLLQVHDELIIEVPDRYIPDVVEVLKTTLPTDELSVPLTVTISVGKNWGEMKEYGGS